MSYMSRGRGSVYTALLNILFQSCALRLVHLNSSSPVILLVLFLLFPATASCRTTWNTSVVSSLPAASAACEANSNIMHRSEAYARDLNYNNSFLSHLINVNQLDYFFGRAAVIVFFVLVLYVTFTIFPRANQEIAQDVGGDGDNNNDGEDRFGDDDSDGEEYQSSWESSCPTAVSQVSFSCIRPRCASLNPTDVEAQQESLCDDSVPYVVTVGLHGSKVVSHADLYTPTNASTISPVQVQSLSSVAYHHNTNQVFLIIAIPTESKDLHKKLNTLLADQEPDGFNSSLPIQAGKAATITVVSTHSSVLVEQRDVVYKDRPTSLLVCDLMGNLIPHHENGAQSKEKGSSKSSNNSNESEEDKACHSFHSEQKERIVDDPSKEVLVLRHCQEATSALVALLPHVTNMEVHLICLSVASTLPTTNKLFDPTKSMERPSLSRVTEDYLRPFQGQYGD